MNLLDLLFASMVGAAAMHIYKKEQKVQPAPLPPISKKKPIHPYHVRFSLN